MWPNVVPTLVESVSPHDRCRVPGDRKVAGGARRREGVSTLVPAGFMNENGQLRSRDATILSALGAQIVEHCVDNFALTGLQVVGELCFGAHVFRVEPERIFEQSGPIRDGFIFETAPKPHQGDEFAEVLGAPILYETAEFPVVLKRAALSAAGGVDDILDRRCEKSHDSHDDICRNRVEKRAVFSSRALGSCPNVLAD